MDVHTKEQRSKNMSAIRGSHTKIETLLAKALWARGYRYRRDNRKITGRPDFTFRKAKVAVFCDGEFFHGKDWHVLKKKIGNNKEFWIKKIQGNIDRDKKVNASLKLEGWTVIRFWGNDIKKDLDSCVKKIETVLRSKN